MNLAEQPIAPLRHHRSLNELVGSVDRFHPRVQDLDTEPANVKVQRRQIALNSP